MAKKNFIPLCMMPFIANMMADRDEGGASTPDSFVLSEVKKYLENKITVEINNENRTTGYVKFNDAFWEEHGSDIDAYWAEHGEEYGNTSIHFKLTNYVGNPEKIHSNTASWEFDVTFDNTFSKDLVSERDVPPTILGTASCTYIPDPHEEVPTTHLTGYSAVQEMMRNATSCDFEVTIDGKSFIMPTVIYLSEK